MAERNEVLSSLPKVLISDANIQKRVAELAQQINQDYQGQKITAICTLKGSFVFYSDLIRQLDLPLTCEFLGLSSYGKSKISSGEVKVTLDLSDPIEDQHVMVIEDIVDTGLTLKYLVSALQARKPASLKSCALLVKPKKLKVPVEVDYVGFSIGEEFVVGYGIDHAERYRELPYIGYLENEH